MKMGQDKLQALQALRAIAAGLVVLVHAFDTYREKVSALGVPEIKLGLGELGVQIFFCISGFIIYRSSMALPPGGASVRGFLARRLVRVAPMYWLATGVYALKLWGQGTPPSWQAVVQSLLFIPFADERGLMRPVLGVGWTLNYEMAFYLLLGVWLWAPRAWRYRGVAACLVAAVVAGQVLQPASQETWMSRVWLLSGPHLLFFLVGMLVAAAQRRGVAPLTAWPLDPTLTVAGGVVLWVMLAQWGWLAVPVPVVLTLALCCGLVAVASADQRGRAGGRGPLLAVLALAGDASFSTYLTHGFVMGPCARVLHGAGVELPAGVFAGWMLVVCTAAGIGVYLVVERPLLRAVNGVLFAARGPEARGVGGSRPSPG